MQLHAGSACLELYTVCTWKSRDLDLWLLSTECRGPAIDYISTTTLVLIAQAVFLLEPRCIAHQLHHQNWRLQHST